MGKLGSLFNDNKTVILLAIAAVAAYFLFKSGMDSTTKLIKTLGEQKILLLIIGLGIVVFFLKPQTIRPLIPIQPSYNAGMRRQLAYTELA